jgi:cytochrome c oxidase subunit 2
MRIAKNIFAVVIFSISASTLAQTLETPNETVTGEELFVVCGFCHGASGQGSRRRDGPALAGLPAWYLELQMRNYIDGIRGTHSEDIPGKIMYFSTGMLRNDYTVSSLAKYIEGLEPGIPMRANAIRERSYVWESTYAGFEPGITGNPETGKQTYQSICSACHGADGVGDEALGTASLVYFSERYVARQLKYFRDGIRGADPRDVRGMQMAAMSRTLTTDQAIADVASYIISLRPDGER